MKTLRLTYRGATELRYANPTAFEDTAIFKLNVQPKKAGSLTVHNAIGTINLLRGVDLAKPEGCDDACASPNSEKLSLRFSISGSTKSHAEVLKLWTDFKAMGDLAIPDMASGFLPDGANFTVENGVV